MVILVGSFLVRGHMCGARALGSLHIGSEHRPHALQPTQAATDAVTGDCPLQVSIINTLAQSARAKEEEAQADGKKQA